MRWLAPLLLIACTGDDPQTDDTAGDTALSCEPPGEQRIEDGTPTDGYPAVVAVNDAVSAFCARSGVPQCTGTVVGPRRVLTAAHCLRRLGAEELGIVFGDTADHGYGPLGWGLEGTWFRPVEGRVHPEYDEQSGAYDLALLLFAEDLPATPIDLVASVDTGGLPGTNATVVGFGGSPFAKKEGTVVLETVDATAVVYGPDPSMTCAGDSGGPVLLGDATSPELLAVTTRGDLECVDYGAGEHAGAIRDWVLAP